MESEMIKNKNSFKNSRFLNIYTLESYDDDKDLKAEQSKEDKTKLN